VSEEILKALMQLFAIITKQDGGVEEKEKSYVRSFLIQQLGETGTDEYYHLFLSGSGQDDKKNESESGENKLTSVLDSVRILGICKKINKTLNQSQKIVVLVRLFELVYADKKLTQQRLAIINTVSDVFRVTSEENKSIETFALESDVSKIDNKNILILNNRPFEHSNQRHLRTDRLDKEILILRIPDVNLYFIKYTGHQDLFLNGLGLHKDRIYLFARGSTVKLPKGKPIYYSDISTHFLIDSSTEKLSFIAKDLSYTFKNGHVGLRNIDLSATQGDLIAIMGASGTGKTTLLNVLSGIDMPSSGSIRLNGIDLFAEKEKLNGVIGFIPQDDLLIEELTVYENLFYNAKLCFKDLTDQEIGVKVENTLISLGLIDKKGLKVGSHFNKTISGGQRKRLNIALEMIREPSILFVDEPTSGLSSRDSENVMDLLRELSLKGKLIFAVIHQPSSEIYKMFDRVIIMDEGGYMIYCGNPVEGVMYFKKLDAQINSEVGECAICGNVNPELIFNIIEARVVDEYGNYTQTRKVSPRKWEEFYHHSGGKEKVEEIHVPPPKDLRIPSWFKQFKIYCTRDLLAKISNRQYVILTLLETPVLGFILSYIIRYIADPTSDKYIFRENENIPIYIFMTLIVALFIGLQLSAEEIFRDRKILKREKFLNLSRSGYLIAKISILFFISALQALAFVLVANSIVEVKGMLFVYWFAFFTTAAYANMLGLNISASFDSAVLIYILIPLVIIPMMVLSGAMFSFDKLNRNITRVDKVPLLAEFMPTKWSYEALMVYQFKQNNFESAFYDVEKRINNADFKQSYTIPELEEKLTDCEEDYKFNGKIINETGALKVVLNEIQNERKAFKGLVEFDSINLNALEFDLNVSQSLRAYLSELNLHYLELFTAANREKTNMIRYLMENKKDLYYSWLDMYYNESVSDEVRKIFERKKIVEYNSRLIQKIDPVFLDPQPSSALDFRSHFYAPRKHLFGRYFDTYWFNMSVIWLLTLFFYFTLYYDILRKMINFSFSQFRSRLFKSNRPDVLVMK
jgi:ABC-type multidrug transport system ATPase subunit